MKILHIIAGAQSGGAETFCADMIKSLHSQGISQRVMCRSHENFAEILDTRSIPYTSLSFSKWTKFLEQKKIKAEIKDYQPDLVHCWMSRASSFAPVGLDIPVLGWFGSAYKLKNFQNCDYHMGVTKYIVRHIVSGLGKPHNAFLGHTFGTLDQDPPISREDFNIPEDAKVVLLLSRMHWKKGVDLLLQAAQNIPDVYFIMAGDGPDLEKYRRQCTDLGLDDRVRFPGWRTDRAALLSISDVCTLPSRVEAFGTVIAESWFAKVPLVATRADGAVQYVTHEHDGLLCDIDDLDGLTQQLKTALFDDEMRETLIENGTATYNALFEKEIVTQKMLQHYQYMIHNFRAESRFVDVAQCGLSPKQEAALHAVLDMMQKEHPEEVNVEAVFEIAAAYAHSYDADDVVLKAVYIECRSLYDFRKYDETGRHIIEILNPSQLDHILENEFALRDDSFFSAAQDIFLMK